MQQSAAAASPIVAHIRTKLRMGMMQYNKHLNIVDAMFQCNTKSNSKNLVMGVLHFKQHLLRLSQLFKWGIREDSAKEYGKKNAIIYKS